MVADGYGPGVSACGGTEAIIMAWRDLIWHNFWWKVASLILAILVWFTVRPGDWSAETRDRATETTRRFDGLPVRVMTDAADAFQYRVVPDNVMVVIRGARTAIARLSERDIDTF